MQIIPVLDLQKGMVVHARCGERESYRPLQSSLCQKPEPLQVIQSLLSLYPFKTLYIADLDAITGQGDNLDLIQQLSENNSGLQIWLDGGIKLIDQIHAEVPDIVPVLGSETNFSITYLTEILGRNIDCILSLDFTSAYFLGDESILSQPEYWPNKIIHMSLGRVGSESGADIQGLLSLLKISAQRQVFAAGGIRNMDDLMQIKKLGCAGALVATALHNGSIGRAELEQIST